MSNHRSHRVTFLVVLLLVAGAPSLALADHDVPAPEPPHCAAGTGPIVTEECREDWVARLDGPGIASTETGRAVAISPDGSTVFTAASGGIGSQADLLVWAMDAQTGHEEWIATVTVDAPGDGFARELAVSPDGSRLFLAGAAGDEDGELDGVTAAFDASSGEVLWTAEMDLGPSDYLGSLATDGEAVYAIGSTETSEGDTDLLAVSFDADDGTQRWITTYDGTAESTDGTWVNSLALSPDGSSLYAVGTSRGNGTFYDVVAIAYDTADGEMSWVTRYGGSSVDEGLSLALSPDGQTVYVGGRTVVGGERGSDFLVLALDASDGEERWEGLYDGPTHRELIGTQLVVDPKGERVYIAGLSDDEELDPGWWDYTVVAYETTEGKQVWEARYSAPLNVNEVAWGLAVAPNGSRVVVTGESWGLGTPFANQGDIVTVALEADTGEQAWVARYNGITWGWDVGQDVVVGPDSERVYVVGAAQGVPPTYDAVVLAYELWGQPLVPVLDGGGPSVAVG